jgi:toxin ParE1/3/4
MGEYRLTPAAEQDLENIWYYTQQQWGAQQANRYIATLVDAFTELAQAPKAAPSCDYIRVGYRRCTVKRHAIYFYTTDYGIDIVRLLHERMDANRHL